MPSRDAEKPELPGGSPEPNPVAGRVPCPVEPGRSRVAMAAASWLAAAPPPAVSSGPSALTLLKALQRRWLLASSLGVCAAVLALVALLLLVPTRYSAFSTLQVSATPSPLQDRPHLRTDFPTFMKTQANRIKNRDILLKALNDDAVRNLYLVKRHPDTMSVVTWLEDELKVDFQEGMELLSVSLSGEDPDELVVMVNAITGAYLGIVNGKEKEIRKARVKTVQDFANTTKAKLSEKIALRNTELKGQGVPDSAAMTIKHQNLLAELRDTQKTAFNIQLDIEKLASRMVAHQGSKKTPTEEEIPEQLVQQTLDADPAMKQKQAKAANYEEAVKLMLNRGHREDERTLRESRRELEQLKGEIEAQRRKIRGELFERYRKNLDEKYEGIQVAFQSELQPLEKQLKKVQDRIDYLRGETETIGLKTAKIDLLTMEIEQDEKKLAKEHDLLKSLQVEEESEPRVSSVQDAVWQVKDARRRLILLVLAPFAALLFVCLGVAWWEFRARRIRSTDEVASGLGMRVLGAVPPLPSASHRFLGLQDPETGPDHNLVESIDGIRTMLLRDARMEATRVVMVTSAVAGEGKTTLASNLALSLARAGRRTLLVDCDLRRPAMHQLFEQTLQPGFSEALLGEVELPDAVRPTTTDPNLWLLPAGQWDREVIQDLAKEGMQDIFTALKAEFDFVVVDSHPVLPATDSLLIGQHVDAVLVSVMRDLSQAPRVYAACQRLATLGIRVIGTVVNNMPADVYQGSYSYTYTAPAVAA